MACGIFPEQVSNLCPIALAGRFLTTWPPGKPLGLFDYSHPSEYAVVSLVVLICTSLMADDAEYLSRTCSVPFSRAVVSDSL